MNHALSAGILLGVTSAAAANVGVVVEKLAIRRMPPLDARKTTAMVGRLISNPVWVIGFITIAAGLAMQVVALSLASISVVQAVAPTGTVLLLVLSHVFLGDRLRRAEYFGIAALVVALGLLLLSLDSHSDQATGSTNLSVLLAVTIPTLCASVSCFVVASRVRGSAQHRRRLQAPLYGLATGLLYGGAALGMKSLSTLMQRSGVVRAVPQILASPVFYLFLATSLLAFLMFQMALQRSITSVLVPVSSVLSTAYFVVVGDALFHEHLPRAPLSLSLRLASFAMLAVGLLTLTVVNEAEGAEQQGGSSGLAARAPVPGRAGSGPPGGHTDSDGEGFELSSGRALPIGFSGSMWTRLPVFALVAVGTILIAVLPFPHDAGREISIAGFILLAVVAAALLIPWEKLPDLAWLVVPIGYIAVIAIIRDAQGGADSGLVALYVIPIAVLALYGRRSQLLIGLFCLDLALLVPLLIVGPPTYPTVEWRQVAVVAIVTALVASTVNAMVSRQRAVRRDLGHTARIARVNAREATSAREHLETLLRAATGSAFIVVDPSGLVTFFSAGAEEMFGYPASEVVGIRSIADFIDPAQIEERRRTVPAMRSPLEPLDAEAAAAVPWTATRRDGQRRRCVIRGRALPANEAGFDLMDDALCVGHAGYVVVAIDVTEREELAGDRDRLYAIQMEVTQSLIEQNNRLRELTQLKDDVVATVSHELRTPITSISGFVELLLDASCELTESQVGMLQTIGRNANQLQRVAEDLLADPGFGSGLNVAFSELDLVRVAAEAVDAMQISASVAGVVMTTELCDHEVPIVGSLPRLHQLLGNLLSNAIKFSPRHGRVRVAVDTSGDYARVQVMDEGPGIPVEKRGQLFERFYRLASSTEMGLPGAGLGLAIAKSVAEAHEGFVDIADTPGWSTTFRVLIPLRTEEAQAKGIARLPYAGEKALECPA